MKLSMVADDFTGANDLALQLIKYGLDIKSYVSLEHMDADSIGVVTTESRNIAEADAVKKCKEYYSKLIEDGYDYFFKKIDSTLRGNVKAEVEVLKKLIPGEKIAVVVPFPQNNRIVIDGRHYVEGMALHESSFAKDPVHPIKTNVLKEYFGGRRVSLEEIRSGRLTEILKGIEEDLVVFDGETDSDLEAIAGGLCGAGMDRHIVGSAAIMEHMLKVWGYAKEEIIIVSGSCNDKNIEQIDTFLKSRKINRVEYYPAEDRVEDMCIGEDYLIRSIREKREMEATLKEVETEKISKRLAREAVRIIRDKGIRKIISSGGDISIELMIQLGLENLEIEAMIEEGIAYGKSGEYEFITKPGGFGNKNIYEKMYSFLKSCR